MSASLRGFSKKIRAWFTLCKPQPILRKVSLTRLGVEPLEDRLAPSTFTVLNLNDSGAGSLRQAILNANTAGGANTIAFNTVALTGPGLQLITLASALPTITDQVTIDGTTQPGYAGTPLIDINDNSLGGSALTLSGSAANGSVLMGFEVSGYTGTAIALSSVNNATLRNLNLSEPSSYNPVGINASSSNNVTIAGVTASGIGQAILVQSSTNPTIQNNTVNNDSTAIYLNNVTSLAVGAVSGNNYSGSSTGLRIDNGEAGLTIGNASVAGAQIVIEDGASGMSTVTGNAIYLHGNQSAIISNLQLGYTGVARTGEGIMSDANIGTGLVIQNVTVTNRNYGIDLHGGGKDLTLTNNTLTNDVVALYVDTFTALNNTWPVIASGNNVAGSSDGFRLWDVGTAAKPETIGTSGTGVVINNTNDGFQTASGNALYLRNDPDMTISNVNLSWTGSSSHSGNGIYCDNNLNGNVTIQNVTVTNRSQGIDLQSGIGAATLVTNNNLSNDSQGLELVNGTDLTVTNNNLNNDSTFAMYLDTFTAVNNTWPVIASGNTVAGSGDGFRLFNLGTAAKPETIGTSGAGTVISNASDGFQTASGNALYLRNDPSISISGLNLSWTGSSSHIGIGIYSDSNLNGNVTIQNVTVTNRSQGIDLQSGVGANALVTNNNLSSDNQGLELINGTDLTVTNNNLDNDSSFAMYLDTFTAVNNTWPVISSGNTVAGSGDGFRLFDLGTTAKPETIGTSGAGIVISNASDGFQTASGNALYLRNVPSMTVSNLNLSWTGSSSRAGSGIYSDANLSSGVTISGITATNRNYGILMDGGGQNVTVTGNNLDNNNTALYVDSFSYTGAFTTPIIASGNNVSGCGIGLELFNMTGIFIGTSGTGIIINNANDGFQTVTSYALYIRNLPGSTINGLNLSYTGSSRTGVGIYSDSGLGAGLTIENVTATNRSSGIQLQGGGQNLTLTGNNLSNDNTALYLSSFSANGAFTTPIIASGNNVTGSANGFQLFNMAGLFIGTSGTGIIINNATDGFQTTGTTNGSYALYIYNLPGSTINGIDLSYSGVGRTGYGIFSNNNLGAGVTIENVTATNRAVGIQLQSGGQNLTVTGNNLSNDNTAMYLDSFSFTGAFTVPVIASGNIVTGCNTGFQLFNLTGQFIGTSGTGIIINNSTDGFQTTSSIALWVRNNSSTIQGVDVSWTGTPTRTGRGIVSDNSSTNLTIEQVIAEGRSTGIEVDGGNTVSIQNSALSNDATGISANNASNTTHVNQNRIVGNSNGLAAQSGGTQVDATSNYWGPGGGAGQGGNNSLTGNATATSPLSAVPIGTPIDFVVTTTSDAADGNTSSIDALRLNPGADGAISLREAILAADNTPGAHTIIFAIGAGAQTITLTSSLPTITGAITIDGTSQPGYADVPLITIDDASLGGAALTVSGTNDLLQNFNIINTPGTALAVSGAVGVVLNGLSLSDSGAGTGLSISGSSNVLAENLTVNNRAIGVNIASSTGVSVVGSSITNNTTAGVQTDSASSGVALNQDEFQGNAAGSAVVNNNTSATVDATNSYWGAASGPSNLGGSGDGYTGNVNASPYLSAPPQAITPTTLTVTTSADVSDGTTTSIAALIANPGPDGKISLREAIMALDNTPGGGTIDFAIATGAQTITLKSALPAINKAVLIDGTSQPGYAGTPLITINANLLGNDVLELTTASGDTVQAISVTNYSGTALEVNNAVGAILQNLNLTNTGGTGLLVDTNSNNATIQNINSTGTTYGIEVSSCSNPTIQNNTVNNDGTAIYLNNVPSLAVGAVSGNNYSGSSTGLRIDNSEAGLTIGNASVAGAQIVIEDFTSGMGAVTGNVIYLHGNQPALISNLQLGYTGAARSGEGIVSDANIGTGLIIQNVTATNRSNGIDLHGGGKDLTLTNNTLTNDAVALYVDTFTALNNAWPVIASGNNVAGSTDGFHLWNLGTASVPETIGTSGTGVVINNTNDGFQTASGNALYLRNDPDMTISNVNLSWTGSSSHIGIGIYSDSNLNGNVTIQNVTVTNRGQGIDLQNGVGANALVTNNNLSSDNQGLELINGTDLTVTNNNLDNDSTFAMYLDTFTAVNNTWPVIASGNTVAGSGDGFRLFNLGTATKPETIGTSGAGIVISNASDGFQTASGNALYLRNTPSISINGLNLSWTGSSSHTGIGIYSDSNLNGNVTIQNVTVNNRNYGVGLQSGVGANAQVTNNNLSSDNQGLELISGTDLTVTNNNLTNDNGYAMYLDSFTAVNNTWPVISSGNTVAGSGDGFRLFNLGTTAKPETIGTSGTGIVISNASDGFQTASGNALYLRNDPSMTISNVDLSWTGSSSRTGNGIFSDGNLSAGVTISGTTATNRNYGIEMDGGGQNLTLTGNNLGNNNTALYVDSFSYTGAFTTPIIASGNNVAGSGNGFQLFNMSGIYIGTSGTGIIINNANDGFQTLTNYALYIRNLPSSTVNGLNLSYSGSSRIGVGIYSDGNLGAGMTIENVTATNRADGIQLQGGGQNLTLTGNNLSNDNTAMYLDSFSFTGAFTVPVIASGNTVTGSGNGFQLFNMTGLFIGTSGTGIIINNATDGFQTLTNTALYIRNLPSSTINGVNVSYSGIGRTGYGIYSDGYLGAGVTIENVTTANRANGIYLGNGGSTLTLSNNNMTNDGQSLYVYNFTGSPSIVGSGNTFAGSTNAIEFQNISGLVIGNSIATGVNFLLNSNSGLDSVTGVAIQLVTTTNITIDGVDLSYRDVTRSGYGIYAVNGSNYGLIVQNVTASNRQIGLEFNPQTTNAGYLVTVTNSNFINNDTGLNIVQYNTGGGVTNNNIEENGTGLAYSTAGSGIYSITLNATGNYWGPGGGPGIGANNGFTSSPASMVNTSGFLAGVPATNFRDYGGDPSAFGFSTNLFAFGARSIVSGPYFGTTVPTATADGIPSTLVSTPNPSTNGIAVSTMVPGQMATATIIVSGAPSGAKLDGWIDFQQDGTWTDAGDEIAVDVPVVNGTNTFSFPVPAGASISLNYARFRISTAGGQNPYGQAADGEVEDLAVGNIYVDKDWAGYSVGAYITDADPVMAGNQIAVFGVNAFATINGGIAAASPGGLVIVSAGTLGTPGDYSGEAVSITQSALTVELQQGNITVGSLADTVSNANLVLSGVSLTAGGNNNGTLFSSTISGNGSLTKIGGGTLTLAGASNYTGTTTVSAGTLALSNASNDNIPDSPTVAVSAGADLDVSGLATATLDLASGQTLQGAGTVTGGAVSALSGSVIAPGTPGNTGILSAGSVILHSGSTFDAVVNGGAPGAQYTQVDVTGSVSLGNATLNASGTVTSSGIIVLIDSTAGVSGIFNGLPEGSVVTINSQGYTISYLANGGTEVTLKVPNRPPTAPVDTDPMVNGVVAAAPVGATVGITAHSTDPDGDTVTYSLTADSSSGAFQINANSGVVTVANTSLLGAIGTSYSITVQANDGNGGTASTTFSLIILATTDIYMDGSGDLIAVDIAIGGKNDDLIVTRDNSNANMRIHDPNNQLYAGTGVTQIDAYTVEAPIAAITGNVQVNTNHGVDLLTIDYATGNPLPAGGLSDLGGTSNGDQDGLVLIGGGAQNAVYIPDGSTANQGTVNVDGTPISFLDPSKLDISGMNTATIQPPNTTTSDTLNIADGFDFFAGGTNPAEVVTGNTGSTAPDVAFYNDTTLVVDTSVNTGNDSVTISSATNANNLTIMGDAADTLYIAGAVSIAGAFDAETLRIDLNAAVTGGQVTLNGNTVLGASVAVSATGGGSVTFGQTVDGPYNLNADTTGTTTFSGAVGAATPLGSLTTDAGGSTDLNGSGVNTTGMQTYNDAVVLTHDETLTAGANIHFASTVDSDTAGTPRNLTLSATGNINVDQAVGSNFPLASLLVSTATNATFSNTITTTTANSSTGNVTQTTGAGTTTFNGGSVAGNLSINAANITFTSATNMVVAGAVNLTDSGTGLITGTIAAGTSTITLMGGTVKMGAANRFSSGADPVVLVGSTILIFQNFSQTFGSLASSVTGSPINSQLLQLGSGALTTGNSFNTEFDGVISGTNGALTKQGSDTFTLGNANTYTGATTINAGMLLLGATGSLSSATAVTIQNGTSNASALTLNNSAGQTVAALHLLDGAVATNLGTPPTLTSTSTYDVRNGFISVNLAGSGSIGLTKTTSATGTSMVTIAAGTSNTYGGVTMISGGMLTLNGTLMGTGGAVDLTGASVTLNGTGSITGTGRGVVVTGAGDTIGSGTIGTAGSSSGLTISVGATGVTVNSTGSVVILGSTIKTGAGNNNIGVLINAGKALLQDDNLSAVGLPSTPVANTSYPYYGLEVEGGASADAGQVGGANYTGLGISAGNNTVSGYQNYVGATNPTSLAHPVAQAIMNLNTNSPNNKPGPQGQPYDLYAQNDNFGWGDGNTGTAGLTGFAGPAYNGSNGTNNSNYSAIELMVYHDYDLSSLGFVNYVTSSAVPELVTTLFYSVTSSELGAQLLAFTTGITGGSFTLTLGGETTNVINWSSSTLATNIQTALASLPYVGAGNVLVAGTNNSYLITFVGALAQSIEPKMTYSSNLIGGSISSLVSFASERSMIRRVAFAFTNYVAVSAGAFALTMNGAMTTYASSWTPGGSIAMTETQFLFDPSTGQFRYEYGFATGQSGVEAGGSLTDGEYQLAFNTNDITGPGNIHPTIGTGVGTYNNPNSAKTPGMPNGVAYVGSGSNYTLNFHRLFGDMDGMGYIDAYSINAMAVALRSLSGEAGYDADLDYNNDGSIDTTTDNPQFTKRKVAYTGTGSAYIGLGWDV